MKQYSDIIKQEVIQRHKSGLFASRIAESFSISRRTVYKWIKERENDFSGLTKANFNQMENKIKRLEMIVEILQNIDCTVSSPLDKNGRIREEFYEKYPVRMLCDALKVPQGTFYNFIFRNIRDNAWYSKRQEELKIKIQEVFDENKQVFGAGKVAAVLNMTIEQVKKWSESSYMKRV